MSSKPKKQHFSGAENADVDVDAAINQRLVQRLMENATRSPSAPAAPLLAEPSKSHGLGHFIGQAISYVGVVALMAVLGLLSYFDRKEKLL